jgi:hypothetical protein
MKRLLGLTLALVLVLAVAAAAAAKTVIFTDAHGGDFVSKPEKLKYSNADTGHQGTLKVKDLHWKNWGSDKATSSSATVKLCSDAAGCFTTEDASAKAKKRQELDSIGYYRKLVVYFGQNAIKFSLPTP